MGTKRLFCDDCHQVIAKPGLCPACRQERDRLRRLRWQYKRKPSRARDQRRRPKKDAAA